VTKVGTPDRRGSFAIYFPFGYYKCFRCATRGVIGGWVTDHKSEDFNHEGYRAKTAPDWFEPLWTEVSLQALSLQPAVQYAESRGFDLAIREAVGMGAAVTGDYAGRLIIPHTDAAGVWWGFTARCWFPKAPSPYMYPPGMTRDRLFNEVALTEETDDPALLMEGVLDGALYWPDCLGGLGKPIEDHVAVLKQTRRPIAVCLDGDAWREGERFMWRLRLEGIRAGAVRLPPGRDPNDRRVDPADLRKAARASIDSPRVERVPEKTE